MSAMNKLVWLCLGSLVLLGAAQAASFDCNKAQTQVEKLICASNKLSTLDESLDKAYRQALKRAATREQPIIGQRQWLRNERNVCQTDACLEAAYTRRIRELELTQSFGIVILQPDARTTEPRTLDDTSTHSPPSRILTASSNPAPSASHVSACHAVAKASNEQKLDAMILRVWPKAGWADGEVVDVNNDGRPERVMGRATGHGYVNDFDAFDDKGTPLDFTTNEKDDWDNEKLRFAQARGLIRYGGQIYILGWTDEYLEYLSRIDQNNVESVICQFGHRPQPIDILTKSTNDKVCHAAAKRSLEYISFEHEHRLTDEALVQAKLRETSAGDFAAKVDIDNDGKLDLVVSLNLSSGRGFGCDGQHLGVLNRTRDRLDVEKTGRLPEPRCGAVEQSAFVFARQTYIEIMYPARRPSNNHEVLKLKSGQLQTVCKFDVRLVHYVLGE